MSMAYIWSGIVVFSVIYGFVSGTINEVGSAAIDGAEAAVTLCLGIAAVTCLWSGIAEVMRRAGIMSAIARIMKPVLRRLYPENASNDAALDAISANVSANMLGLGNAATPLGIKAAELMSHGRKKRKRRPMYADRYEFRIYTAYPINCCRGARSRRMRNSV